MADETQDQLAKLYAEQQKTAQPSSGEESQEDLAKAYEKQNKAAQPNDERYNLTHPEAGKLPGVTKPTQVGMQEEPLSQAVLGGEHHLTPEERMNFPKKPINTNYDPAEDFKQGSQMMTEAGGRAGKALGHAYVEGLANQRGPGGGYAAAQPTEHPLSSEEVAQQHPTAYGVAGGVGEFAGSMALDPTNWALAATGAEAGPVLNRLASAAFAAKMGPGVIDGAKQLGANWDKMTPEQRAEGITQLGLGSLFTALTAEHTMAGEGGSITGKGGVVDLAKQANESIVKPAVRATSGALADTAKVGIPAMGAGLGTAIAAEAGVPHPYMIGGAGGAALGRAVTKPVTNFFEKGRTFGMSPEEAAVSKLERRYNESAKDLTTAKAELDTYSGSREQGVEAPADVVKNYEKAKAKADEDRFHLDAARERLDRARNPQPAATPAADQPITPESIVKPQAEPATEKPIKPINVKGPGEVQPETFPQEPKEKPQVPGEGQTIPLANEGVRVGKPRALPPVPVREPAALPEKASAIALPENTEGVHNEEGRPRVEGSIEGKPIQGEILPPEQNVESLKPSKNAGFPEATVEKKRPTRLRDFDQIENEVRKGVGGAEPLKANEPIAKKPEGEVLQPSKLYSLYDEFKKNNPTGKVDIDAMLKLQDDMAGALRKENPGISEEQVQRKLNDFLNDHAREGQAKTATKEEPLSSDPRKHVLLKAGATPEEVNSILQKGATAPTSKVGLSKLAEHFGVDLGQSAIGRGKADIAAGTHLSPADVLQKIIDAGHSPADIAKAVSEGKHLPPVSGGSQGAEGTAPAKDEQAQKLKEETAKTSAKDTDHVKQAMSELGADAKLSDVMKRAQELKDQAKTPVNVAKSADEYNKEMKLPKIAPEKVAKDTRAAEIADDFQKMEHDPNDPYVKKSYNALVDDVKKQWDFAKDKMSLKIEPTDTDPYHSYEEMRDDVNKNRTMKVWRGGNELPKDHPLAKVDPDTGESYNTMFRAVHDIFGHVAQDHDFSEPGEESAWNVHRQMMTPEAVPAMTTETRGQTSWFFNNEGVRGGEPLGKFADQKAGLLPEYANERTPEAGKTLDHIKAGKEFAVLTAENPMNERVSDAENSIRNRKLVADLRDKGYKVVPVEGFNKDVEGKTEHSFFVPDISAKDAAEFGREHGQASILTHQGLHDLKKDTVNPSDNKGLLTGAEAEKQPYYSKVGGESFSVPLDFSKEDKPSKISMAHDIGEWKPPAELGQFSAEDVGKKARQNNPEPTRKEVERGAERRTAEGKNPEGEERRTGEDRRKRQEQQENDKLFKMATKELGPDATDEQITKRMSELREEGAHLPTVSGGSQSATAKKELPTGDQLIKKYGESSGDPAHTTFILSDGRGVANTGTDHDVMLGGRATDKNPPREKFIAQGNIRVRPRMGQGGREVSFSIPESGVNSKQLDYLKKMAPQLKSGAVLVEVGKPHGAYQIIQHGNATPENLEKTIRNLAPVLNDKGAPIDEFGNPTVSGGSPEAKQNAPGEDFTHTLDEDGRERLKNVKDRSTIIVTPKGYVHVDPHYDPSLEEYTHSSLFNQLLSFGDENENPELQKYWDEDAGDYDPPGDWIKFQEAGGIRAFTTGPDHASVSMYANAPAGTIAKALRVADALGRDKTTLEIDDSDDKFKTLFSKSGTYEQLKNAVYDWADKNGHEVYPEESKNPSVSGGSPSAGTAEAKTAKVTPKELQQELKSNPALKELTESEAQGITTSATGRARVEATDKFIKNMATIPEVQEYVDIARQGEGARKWYQRSTAAFDAMKKLAPDYFKEEGDRDKFLGVLAGSSPQQSVAMNLRETLGFWKAWVDAGRPELSVDKWQRFGETADAAWKEDGSPRVGGNPKGMSKHWDYAPTGKEWANENLLLKNLTLPDTKVPNIIKALNGEDMWPDLTKNAGFKAPSFAQNLRGWLNHVTNDSWMGLFGNIDKYALSKPESYHPLSVATREAAKVLGWEPAEAQAAIWSFTQALTERGTEDPELVRKYSEDFADLMANDVQTRNLLEDLGVNLDDLDKHLDAIGEKPEVSGRTTATTSRSVGKLKERIETARGKGAIPKPKADQSAFNFRERPTNEGRNRIRDEEDISFNPEEIEADERLRRKR